MSNENHIDLSLFVSPEQCDTAIGVLQLHKRELLEAAAHKAQKEARKQLEADFLALMDRSAYAVEEAILRLFDRQTSEEKNNGRTHASNGQGVNVFHAPFVTWAADILNKGGSLYGKSLVKARKIAKFYKRQLVDMMEVKQQA